jgi:hypothetical protein
VILTVRLSLVPFVILLTARSQAGLEQPHRC